MSVSAIDLLKQADELRRNNLFGEAINVYRAAAAAPDATDDIIKKFEAKAIKHQDALGNHKKR